jgi:putative flavoprotein involved in K+ transport
VGVREGRAQFSGSLTNVCALADLKQARLLDQIDEHARRCGLDPELEAPSRPESTRVPIAPLELDLTTFGTVVWATGFRPRYPWLDAGFMDGRGRLVHDGGILSVPGAYVLGLPFLRRRKSSFIDGVGDDARDLTAHLAHHLDLTAAHHR